MNPTQVAYPWRAAVRTVLAYLAGAGIVVPIAWTIAQETLGAYLSPGVITAIAWTVGLIVAVSGFITRVMAIPAVNELLTRLGVGATPAEVPRGAIDDESDVSTHELDEWADEHPADPEVEGTEGLR